MIWLFRGRLIGVALSENPHSPNAVGDRLSSEREKRVEQCIRSDSLKVPLQAGQHIYATEKIGTDCLVTPLSRVGTWEKGLSLFVSWTLIDYSSLLLLSTLAILSPFPPSNSPTHHSQTGPLFFLKKNHNFFLINRMTTDPRNKINVAIIGYG